MRWLILGVALALAGPVAAQESENDTGWKYVAAQDSVTGEDKSDARVVKEPNLLSFGCSDDSLTFRLITWTEDTDVLMALAQAEEAEVSWQVDQAEGGTFKAAAATATVSASGEPTRRFADQVASGRELTLRVMLSGEGAAEISDTFNLSGSSRALNRLPCYP